jgi:1-acyl-sn-glycerol-3-phosphate acyltransferase
VAPRATTAARALYTAYVGAVGAVLLLTLWPLAVLLPDRAWTRGVGRFGARLLLLLSGVRVRVTGTEHLARGGPFVLACNHASYTDVPLLMAACPVGFAFVAKKEVVGWPLVGRFVRCAGHLPVERFEAREGVADASRIAQALRGGDCVLFFPEGTFTAARGLRPFRLGAFKLAVETGVPVVPLALSGTRRLLRGEERLLRPGPVELWIGPPLSAQGDSFRAAVALRDRVAEAIGQHAGEMVLRHVVAGPERA